jgi:hypothetical protein
MKTAMIPLGAGTIGLGLGLAIAAWRGDLAAHEAGRQPLSLLARSDVLPSTPGQGLSWVADARSLRPAPAPSATHVPQWARPPQPRIAGTDGPAVPTIGAADDDLPDDSDSAAIGEPVDADSYLQARDRAAAHSARSN